MIIIDEFITPTHNLSAKIEGFITTKDLVFYDESDEKQESGIPSTEECWPEPPCLVWSVIDEELSSEELKLMKPVKWIHCTKEQAEFLKKFFQED